MTAQEAQALLGERGAVHAASTVYQVMRLIHQQPHSPVVGLSKPVQQRVAIEPVVYIPHRHIGPAGQLLTQIVGANLMRQRHFAQRIAR